LKAENQDLTHFDNQAIRVLKGRKDNIGRFQSPPSQKVLKGQKDVNGRFQSPKENK